MTCYVSQNLDVKSLLIRASAQYVVSGSDGGHLFIWDKKTSELVNILEGDDEVVNVVQGEHLEYDLATPQTDTFKATLTNRF